jgi:hypothetical protein
MKMTTRKLPLVMANFYKAAMCASVVSAFLVLQGCGGNGAGAAGAGSTTVSTTKVNAANLQAKSIVALTNQPNLPSDGKLTATITAFVKDEGNRALADVEVLLSSTDTGVVLQQVTTKTGADGSITGTLNLTAKNNRTVQVKATIINTPLVATIDVPVTGTTVAINGPLSLPLNGTGEFSLAVKDSAGNAVGSTDVTLKSTAGNTFAPATVKTDPNGQAKFTLNVSKSGSDSISATAAGTATTVSLKVASDQLTFTGIAVAEEVIVNAVKPAGILFQVGGAPAVGKILALTATRGVLSIPGGGTTVTTDATGRATFSISSPNAGPSVISVMDVATSSVATSSISFISTTPAVVKLQAAKPVLPANAIGASGNTSDLIANVKDSFGNPVKGVVVSFSANADPSNGRIEPASAVTDVAGNASAVFVAGPTVTGPDQVVLKAIVSGTSIAPSTASLTVASRQVSIRLGTGNKIEYDGPTRYKFPWTAVVVDSSGAPIQNANVTVQVVPIGYYKGSWVKVGVPTSVWRVTGYVTDTNGDTPPGGPTAIGATYCASEDTSPRDSTLQSIEDLNKNGKLDPGNVATSDVEPTGRLTGVNGFIDFNVVYARSFAEFSVVRIDVRAKVDGTESVVSETFTLPMEATDAAGVAPPAIPGPLDGPFGRIVSDQITRNKLDSNGNLERDPVTNAIVRVLLDGSPVPPGSPVPATTAVGPAVPACKNFR